MNNPRKIQEGDTFAGLSTAQRGPRGEAHLTHPFGHRARAAAFGLREAAPAARRLGFNFSAFGEKDERAGAVSPQDDRAPKNRRGHALRRPEIRVAAYMLHVGGTGDARAAAVVSRHGPASGGTIAGV